MSVMAIFHQLICCLGATICDGNTLRWRRMAAQVPRGFGATPIFDEEFNEDSLNTTIWTYRGQGTVKHDCYIDSSAVAVANGHLRIHIYTAKNSRAYKRTIAALSRPRAAPFCTPTDTGKLASDTSTGPACIVDSGWIAR